MPGAPSLTQSVNPTPNVKPGLVAAWALKFSREDPTTHALADTPKAVTLSSNDYDGDFDLTLPSGLAAGTYKITLYDISDDDYKAISTAAGANSLNAVQLYLFYADNLVGPSFGAKASAYLSNLAGLTSSADPDPSSLVADLRVKGVKRSVFLPPAASGGAGSGGAGGSSGSGAGGGSGGGSSGASSGTGGGGPSAGGGSSGGGSSSAPLRRPAVKFEIAVEERIYSILSSTRRSRDAAPPAATTLEAAVTELLQKQTNLKADTNYKYYRAAKDASSPEPPTHVSFPVEPTIASQMAALARPDGQLERANQPDSAGRGMLLIRNGVLYIGKRDIPLAGSPLDLTTETGLLESTVAENTNPSGAGDGTPNGATNGAKKGKRQFTLTLRGRPDIKPGDVVHFKVADEDAKATTSSLGVLAAAADIVTGVTGFNPADETPDTAMYVDSVQHQLGRRTGFQTTLTGLEIDFKDSSKAWDPFGKGRHVTAAPTAASAAAGAVRGATAQASTTSSQALPEVAEVRAFTSVDPQPKTPPDPNYDPNGQTESVWVGLIDGDSLKPNPVRRVNVDHLSKVQATGVPYLTPFAFGKCGLVLPRYPKMRVLLAYRKGDAHDPIDVGAVWQSGHAPPNAAMGDWWLSLPAKLDGDPDASAPDDDDDSPPADYSGKISQDLTDARGRRAIDVATLRIRACGDTLENAGTKITPAPDGSALVIEHTKNGKTASITIKDDASIEINSDTKITFTSQGDIEMHAANVKVHVSGKMDVAS